MLRESARLGILSRFPLLANPSPTQTDAIRGKSASGSLETNGADMRFSQIDRITQLSEGQSLTGVKCLSLSEGYLQDHFPRCPLMPGVIMMEAMFQASMWLMRVTDRFRHPMVALRATRNVRFRELVEPGDALTIETKLTKLEGNRAEFSTSGTVGGAPAVSGRLTLEQYFLHERIGPTNVDESFMLAEFKRKFQLLIRPDLELSAPVRQSLGLE
jgi:3-hydroxyacyl-[acyl-carrier-protein] dehydratase